MEQEIKDLLIELKDKSLSLDEVLLWESLLPTMTEEEKTSLLNSLKIQSSKK